MTTSSDLDNATSIGQPNAYASTPGEFAARWNQHTEEQRQQWLDHLNQLQQASFDAWLVRQREPLWVSAEEVAAMGGSPELLAKRQAFRSAFLGERVDATSAGPSDA